MLAAAAVRTGRNIVTVLSSDRPDYLLTYFHLPGMSSAPPVHISNRMNVHFTLVTAHPEYFRPSPSPRLSQGLSQADSTTTLKVVHANTEYPLTVGRCFPSREAAEEYAVKHAGHAFAWRVVSSTEQRVILKCHRCDFKSQGKSGVTPPSITLIILIMLM
jgi:hypothetical protein